MLGFIKTKDGVFTFECLPVNRENFIVYYWRVAIENKRGITVKSKWRQGCMSSEGTAINAARKMKGVLYPIQLEDEEAKRICKNNSGYLCTWAEPIQS